jgi:hypothetical protein
MEKERFSRIIPNLKVFPINNGIMLNSDIKWKCLITEDEINS